FLDAMEAATRDQCIALLTDRSPASVADPFWPLVHGEDRVPLPALPELVELLEARGRSVEVQSLERSPRTFDSVPALTAFLRRQPGVGPETRSDDPAGRTVEVLVRPPDATTERFGSQPHLY